jgi:hypothetical protein
LAAGSIGVEHLAAVAAGARGVPAEVLAEHDATLRNLAPHVRPQAMRQAGQAIQAVYDETAAASDAEHVRSSRRLSLVKTFGDAYHLEGLLEPEAGASLSAVLDSLSARTGGDDERTPTQRRADALVELASMALADGSLPELAGDRPRVTFVITAPPSRALHEAGVGHTQGRADLLPGDPPGATDPQLAGEGVDAAPGVGADQHGGSQPPAAGRRVVEPPWPRSQPQPLDAVFTRLLHGLQPAPSGSSEAAGWHVAAYGAGRGRELIGDGSAITDATLTRICCDADLAIAVVNEFGEPLNLGRTSRAPNQAQRRALVLRDKACVFPGCDTAPTRCIVHHLDFWSHLGPTNLENLALVCWYHHHVIHEDGWQLQRLQDVQGGSPPLATVRGWLATAPDGHQLRTRRPAA